MEIISTWNGIISICEVKVGLSVILTTKGWYGTGKTFSDEDAKDLFIESQKTSDFQTLIGTLRINRISPTWTCFSFQGIGKACFYP